SICQAPGDGSRAVAYGVKLILSEYEERVGTFHLIERIAKGARKIARLRAGDQVDDDFGVAIGLEDGATMLELAAPLRGRGGIAVVAESDLALVAVDHDGLRVEKSFIAGSGVARVADGE